MFRLSVVTILAAVFAMAMCVPSSHGAKILQVPGAVSGLNWLPNGRTIIARVSQPEGTTVKPVAVSLDTVTGKQNYLIALGYTRTMAVSPDGKWLAVAGHREDRQAAKVVRLIDAASGQLARELKGHQKAVTALKFNHDSRLLASGGQDWLVKLWDVAGNNEPITLDGHRLQDVKNYRDGWGLACLKFAPDDQTLISAGYEIPIFTAHTLLTEPGEFIIWDLATRSPRARFEVRTWGTGVRFLPDGRSAALLYGRNGGIDTLELVDVATGKQLAERRRFAAVLGFRRDQAAFVQPLHGGEPYADGPFWKRPVELWDLRAGKRLGALPNYVDEVRSLRLSPNGQVVATAGHDKTVRLWDAGSLKAIARLTGHTKVVARVAWSPGGRVLASGSDDGTVRLWTRPTRWRGLQ